MAVLLVGESDRGLRHFLDGVGPLKRLNCGTKSCPRDLKQGKLGKGEAMSKFHTDCAHINMKFRASEIEHRYGDHVHLLSDPVQMTLLHRFCSPDVTQPQLSQLLRSLYAGLLNTMINREFDAVVKESVTRMAGEHPEAYYRSISIDPDQKAVVVNLVRGGIIPGQVIYEFLHYVLPPKNIRMDHIFLNRKTNERGEVVGVEIGGHKIGGPVSDSICIIPDPMAATGKTVTSAIELYEKEVKGKFQSGGGVTKYVTLHLIVTPEYLRTIRDCGYKVHVYACRLDRGLSPKSILETTPGTHWDQEKGLDDRQYIVPGGGGIGEVLNNAFV